MDLSDKRSTYTKKLQLKVNLSLSRLYPVYRKQPMVASESVEKAQPPTASLQPTQADPILFFTTLSRIIVEVKNG